jgi:hypothetical protein
MGLLRMCLSHARRHPGRVTILAGSDNLWMLRPTAKCGVSGDVGLGTFVGTWVC